MYTDETLTPIADNAPYVGADGTKYPANFPKDEIPDLHPVMEMPRPSDTDAVVVTDFIIDKNFVQVWQMRERTEEEKADLLKDRAYDALRRAIPSIFLTTQKASFLCRRLCRELFTAALDREKVINSNKTLQRLTMLSGPFCIRNPRIQILLGLFVLNRFIGYSLNNLNFQAPA